ncbi:MAG: phosphoenolpyruvate carboxykinase [Candidatus Aceula meridiana]|nr:phosphoenolpyruvate carboxykinase [Candidatus Aceula meridiana]
MDFGEFEFYKRKIIIRIKNRICENSDELISSKLFLCILKKCIQDLQVRDSDLLAIFKTKKIDDADIKKLVQTFLYLTKMKRDLVPNVVKGAETFLKDRMLFNDFVEYLYNYWRSFDRFIICSSEEADVEPRPYRIFNETIEQLTHLVRATYRDIEENITGAHPNIYRQVRAGAEVASIATAQEINFPSEVYNKLNVIPMIRQVLLYPPLILNPSMNKRTGVFERVYKNPLDGLNIKKKEWVCYPAKVGELLILIYFHNIFVELGYSLANLFQLADEADLQRKPDAVYCFGVPESTVKGLGKYQTVFFDDEENGMLSAVVPRGEEFGYFGYLKKMVLTLHNIVMMKKGQMPFHGALVDVTLKTKRRATVLLIGDSGAGKSETLEAFREIGDEVIKDINIIADDMGSIRMNKKKEAVGIGTEIGAFLRLDDLKPGYAFGQIDRAIIMSANKVNARIIMPITAYERVIKEHKIDFILYANNYEQTDSDHPLIERITDAQKALDVFKEGTVMSKGTTTATGLVHSYFANIFGPPQYRELHDKIARKFFKIFFDKRIFVGQMRTRLGILGYEQKGPEDAARALLEIINSGTAC